MATAVAPSPPLRPAAPLQISIPPLNGPAAADTGLRTPEPEDGELGPRRASHGPCASTKKKRALSPSATPLRPRATKQQSTSPLQHDGNSAAMMGREVDNQPEPSPPTTAPSAMDPHDLLLLKVIGRGTFAQQVALARHRRTQRMYVVKTLDKSRLVARQQVTHTLTEKRVLERLRHPFIVRLFASFQTDRDLNFVLEYCQGGELFFHLQQQPRERFDEPAARFYAAEVLAALTELHARGIVYRDLKPENVLLDAQGHVKLADFGFAKEHMRPGHRTYSFCGSPEYLSPEMVDKRGHGLETDMWAFGCFLYELLTGAPPFPQGQAPLGRLFDTIRQGRVWYPPGLSSGAIGLLQGLLRVNPQSRLTADEAQAQAFFRDLDWAALLAREVAPPIVPVCRGRDCTENFDDGFTGAPVQSLGLDRLEISRPGPGDGHEDDGDDDMGACKRQRGPEEEDDFLEGF